MNDPRCSARRLAGPPRIGLIRVTRRSCTTLFLASGFACLAVVASLGTAAARAADLIEKHTETGIVVGYLDTPLLPWTDNKYHVHDPNRPIPQFVLPRDLGTPLPAAPAPADAIVLFAGADTSHWQPSTWQVSNRVMVAGHESLQSKQPFGDCQLHLEFATPDEPDQSFMNRGNSGVLMMGKYELQIFDSWHAHPRQIYPDGQAASIYGQTPPAVNACMPPGQWQSYDIIFTAPVFANGKLVKPPTVTMLHNGVLVHRNQEVYGEMMHRDIKPLRPHPAKLPLVLQGHGSKVRFRNIWLRELVPDH